jgi:hypothetical protein
MIPAPGAHDEKGDPTRIRAGKSVVSFTSPQKWHGKVGSFGLQMS